MRTTRHFAGSAEQVNSVSAITHFWLAIHCTRICTRIQISRPTWNLLDRPGRPPYNTRHKRRCSPRLPLSPPMLLLHFSLLRRQRRVLFRWCRRPPDPPRFPGRREPRYRTAPVPTTWQPGKTSGKNVLLPKERCDTREKSRNATSPAGAPLSSRKARCSRPPIPDGRTAQQRERTVHRYAAVPSNADLRGSDRCRVASPRLVAPNSRPLLGGERRQKDSSSIAAFLSPSRAAVR